MTWVLFLSMLCHQQVVLLGEPPSHGESVAFEKKAEIIQHLVKQCGFQTVVFEAPMYEFVGYNRAIANGSATQQQLDDAIGRFWQTKELTPFRAWLFRESAAGRLKVVGMDDQISVTSNYTRSFLIDQFQGECHDVVSRNLYYKYDEAHPFDAAEQKRLHDCMPRDSKDPLLRNFTGYVDRQAGNGPERDSVMYQNLRAQMRGKTVVWLAASHATRQRGNLAWKPVGAYFAGQKGIASVGFTMVSGETSRNAAPVKPIEPAAAGSLEADLLPKGSAFAILGPAALKRAGTKSSRLLGKFTSARWADYFDYVVIVGREKAPTFEARR